MKSLKVIHHPRGDANVFSTVGDELNALTDGTGFVDLDNVGLKVRDTNASNVLIIKPASNLTADRTLSLVTGDADRSLTLTADSSIGGTAYVVGGTDVAIADGGTGQSTATAAFDALAPTTTRGDLIVRGASNNGRLALGTTRQVLESDGTDAHWASRGIVTIASGSLPSATTQAITSIPSDYSYLVLVLASVSSDTATRILQVQVSTDNGLSYDTTSANYPGYTLTGTTLTNNASASLLGAIGSVAAAAVQSVSLSIFGYQGGTFPHAPGVVNQSTPSVYTTTTNYIGSTSAINALKILWNGSGNFDGGSYALYGVK